MTGRTRRLRLAHRNHEGNPSRNIVGHYLPISQRRRVMTDDMAALLALLRSLANA